MAEITSIITLIVALLAIGSHLANMADRNQKEGARKERIDLILAKMEDISSRLRHLETEVGLLKQKLDFQEEELKELRAERRRENMR